MKTIYRPRNRHNTFQKVLLAALAFLVGATLFTYIDSYVLGFVSRAWQAENGVLGWVSSRVAMFESKVSLEEENKSLRREVLSLRAMGTGQELLDMRQREIFSLAGRVERGGILAGVVMRPPHTPYDVLVVDAGAREGVSLGDTVVAEEGFAVGEVVEVADISSKVRLYSSVGVETSVVLERDSSPSLLVGVGGGNFEIMLSREAPVEVGDRVIMAGLVPRLIAVVGDVSLKPTDPFKKVDLYSPIGPFGIRLVKIIK